MTLTNSATLVKHAFANGYGVAQVNANGATYEITRAILDTAQELEAPIILGAYEANIQYCGVDYAGMQLGWLASQYDIPVAVHLDHGHSIEGCKKAIAGGFTSVMIDGSALPIDENIKQARKVVELAKSPHTEYKSNGYGKAGVMERVEYDVTVEAEIGELQILNPDGSMGEAKNLSDPNDAKRMCEEIGIDMLAVGIGNAHGFYKGQPDIRFDILEKLCESSTVPLVLHGSTGLSDNTIKKCVLMGMAKVNLGTLIRTRCVEYTAEVIAAGQHQNHAWRVAKAVSKKLVPHIRDIIEVTGSDGRAEDILALHSA